jgi:hypothetical protein
MPLRRYTGLPSLPKIRDQGAMRIVQVTILLVLRVSFSVAVRTISNRPLMSVSNETVAILFSG